MEAIVLAGGFGTRLRSVVKDVPKPMAPVGGRPFLELLLKNLIAKGCRRFILAIGYKSESIQEYFGSAFHGAELLYSVESTPLGTGGAIKQALTMCSGEAAFVFNGDTYLDLDLNATLDLWHSTHDPILVTRQVDNAERFGAVDIADGRITRIVEGRCAPSLINGGCYVLPTGLLSSMPDSFSFERDYLPEAVTKLNFRSYLSSGYFIDIGIPEDFARAQAELGNA